jgi:hypothetical protein
MRKLNLTKEEWQKRRREQHRLWSSKHKEQLKEKAVAYRLKHPDYLHNYYLTHKEQAKARNRRNAAKRKEKFRNNIDGYRDKRLAESRQSHYRIRLDVLQHYGGNPPKCACCGEANLSFLTIDHINGGGVQHRKTIHVRSGTGFFCWLRRNGYPEGFQVLCFNCNHAKSGSGKRFCPIHHPEEYA